MGGIRTAARALIVRDGLLLLTHYQDESGNYFSAPGGGQEPGETLPETLVRECREEIGAEIEVGGLRSVRDYIPAPGEFSYLSKDSHQLEVFFDCSVPASYHARSGPQVDSHQVGVIWADAAMLNASRVYPARLREVVDSGPAAMLPAYWGRGD